MVQYKIGLEKVVDHIEESEDFQEKGYITLQETFLRNRLLGVLAAKLTKKADFDIKIKDEVIPELEKKDWNASWHDFYRTLSVHDTTFKPKEDSSK